MASTTKTSDSQVAGPSRIPFDPDAPLFVAQATLFSAVLGAGTGASIGVVKAQNPFALATGMGINCGLAGLTFFGMREYLVSPALILLRQSQAQESMSTKARGKLPANQTLTDVRFERVLDSALAGVLAGGTLSGFLRGKATIPRAGLTAGIVTSLLQLSANQFRVIRLQLLAKKSQQADVANLDNPTPTPQPTPKSDFDMSLRSSLEHSTTTAPIEQQPDTLPGQMIRGLSTFLPVWKLSDEDYLALLMKKKGDVERRLREIEVEEMRIFEASAK